MTRARTRQRNPLTRTQKYLIGAAVAGVAVIGTVALATREPRPAAKKPTTKRGTLPDPIPTESTQEGALPTCELGPEYPGYIVQNGRCVPGDATPPGIYIHSDCTDFDFVPGEDSTQAQELQARIDAAVAATAAYPIDSRDRWLAGFAVNPVTIVTEFLQAAWPPCPWPPGADAPARVIQLYMVLAFSVGRSIYNAGGNVLGYDDPVKIDEEIVDKLAEVGITAPLDLTIVPELQLPEITREPPAPAPGPTGPGLKEPGPIEGKLEPIDGFPMPAPPVFPGVQGDLKPDCMITPVEKTEYDEVEAATWAVPKTATFQLFKLPAAAGCNVFKVRFGICMSAHIAADYGLLSTLAEAYPTKTLEQASPKPQFQLRDGGAALGAEHPIPLAFFRTPYYWKHQYEVLLGRSEVGLGGVVILQGMTEIQDESLDACNDKLATAPVPQAGYRAVGTDNVDRVWSNPTFKFVPDPASAFSMNLRITYAGLPKFTQIDGDNVYASMTAKNGYKAYVKVWSLGI